jgi:hypothetical protein
MNEHSTRSINHHCRTEPGRMRMERDGYYYVISAARTRNGIKQVCHRDEWMGLFRSDRVFISLRS